MSDQLTSPYSEGARRGAVFGIIFCAMFFGMAYSQAAWPLGILSLALFFVVPVLLYKFLRQTYIADGGMTTLAGLWMQGIMIFLCGSVICAAATTVFMRWVEPTFLVDLVTQAADVYSQMQTPQADEVAALLTQMVENHAVPSALAVSIEMIWVTSFTGSLLSLFAALIARRAIKSTNQKIL